MSPAALPPAECSRDITQEESRWVLDAIERDRLKLAKMLHDTACQSLSGLQLLASTLHPRSVGGSNDASESLSELTRMLRQTSLEIRTVVEYLHSPSIREGSLIVSLVELCTQASEIVPCEFHCDDRSAKLDHDIAEQFYQIARAAIMAAYHAGKANRIEIILRIQFPRAASIVVSIDRDEVFNDASASKSHSLEDLELRARAIGGRLQITSRGSSGAIVACIVGDT